jgi:capsular polysaccharide biosynthesis protein
MWSFLKKHSTLLLVWGLIIGTVAVGLSLLFPLQYSATSQVLIISRNQSGVDPYTQAKSAERIGENLVEVIQTTDFYGKVMEAKTLVFNKDLWKNLSVRDQRKDWQRDVRSEVVYGTSLLRITTYATTPEEAVNLSNAVSQTIVSRGWEYVSGDVVLKQVDDPLASRFPARPNFILNAFAGFAIGVGLLSLWLLKYRRHLLFN